MGEPENGLEEGRPASPSEEGQPEKAETIEGSETESETAAVQEEPATPEAPEASPVYTSVQHVEQNDNTGLLIRLRAAGPWRYGGDSGNRERIGTLYHSDTIYSAATLAMSRLGMLDDWLEATALASGRPAVRFTSFFPWQGDTFYVIPPRSIWPPASTKIRAKGASFIPVSLVTSLLEGKPFDEDRWIVDGESRCLLSSRSKNQPSGPFRQSTRSFAAVDRLAEGRVEPHRAACVEFSHGSGFWCFVSFEDDEARAKWAAPVEGAFRLLADSGFGGRRSIGWGRAFVEEVRACSLRDLITMPGSPAHPPSEEGASVAPVQVPEATAYWLLSVFSPAQEEQVDWRQGSYTLIARGGRVDSSQGSGGEKKVVRLVEEGSVVFAGSPPNGKAADVAPDGSPHPVFRYGYPVSVRLPERVAP